MMIALFFRLATE